MTKPTIKERIAAIDNHDIYWTPERVMHIEGVDENDNPRARTFVHAFILEWDDACILNEDEEVVMYFANDCTVYNGFGERIGHMRTVDFGEDNHHWALFLDDGTEFPATSASYALKAEPWMFCQWFEKRGRRF